MHTEDGSTFRKLVTWEVSLIVAPSLYILGWAFLGACAYIQPLRSFYLAAGACFLLFVAWSLAALYTHDSLQKPRIRYPRNRSMSSDVPRRRRRRRNKTSRKVTAVIASALFLFPAYKLVGDYYRFTHPPLPDNFEVFVRSSYKTRALRVPPRDDPESYKGMTFALHNIPVIDLQMGESDTVAHLAVIVRNIDSAPAQNVRIRIDTDGTLQSPQANVAAISKTELETVVPSMAVYRGDAGEVSVPIDVPLPHYRGSVGLLMTIESDSGHPYASAVKVQWSRAGDR